MRKKYNKFETYGFWGMIKMFWFLIHTKVQFPHSRMIRLPIDIRGKKFIDFGTNLTTGKGCRIEAFPFFEEKIMIQFGDYVEINDYVHIAAASSVNIGNNVLIASKVYISDIDHGIYSGNLPHDNPSNPPGNRALSAKPVVIEENVWIGESVSILSGVVIGKGSIIGANSVVTKSIPEGVIAVGVPAKPIKRYCSNTKSWELIQKDL